MVRYFLPWLRWAPTVLLVVVPASAQYPRDAAANRKIQEALNKHYSAMEFDRALEWATELSAHLFSGPEGREGMAAYLEKRPPPWAPPNARPD